ncbi:MAG: phosphatidylserine decarboxylase family protein [Candidatus Hodarchaeota archaeon]
MAKEGFGFIIIIILFSIILTLGSWLTGKLLLIIVTLLSWLMVGFSFYFFRDPDRTIPSGENLVLSPADGKIISIESVYEPTFFNADVKKVSIFLSVFDVHINRNPIDGKVTYFNYLRGKFYPAYKHDASFSNEQTVIGIENERCKLLFKQIAGILARRIVCYIREGQVVKKGNRCGMIKFGSRVDLFLPKNVQIQVRLNEHVKGGESIIGLIDEK